MARSPGKGKLLIFEFLLPNIISGSEQKWIKSFFELMNTMGEVKPKQTYYTKWERLDLLKPENDKSMGKLVKTIWR